MIDIHSHILPGIDDGSKSMEETVELLKIARESGTTTIVASPHSDSEYTYDHEKVDELIAEAQQLAGDGIKIVRGCDFHLMFSNVNAAMEHPRRYTINNGPYILMELSDMMIFPNTSDIWRQLENYGIRIILTHPRTQLDSADEIRADREVGGRRILHAGHRHVLARHVSARRR